MSDRVCQHCGTPLPPPKQGPPRKWCSNRCRQRALYTGVCVDCGKSTYSGNATPPERCTGCFNRHNAIWSRENVIQAIRAWADEHGGTPPTATDWNTDNAWPYPNTLRQQFGSWNAAIQAAGFQSRRVGCYGRDGENPQLCREIRERYEQGENSIELAAAYGCHRQTIVDRIRRAGGRIRDRSEAQLIRVAA